MTTSKNGNYLNLSNKTRTYLKYSVVCGAIIGVSYLLYKQFRNPSSTNNNDDNNTKSERQVRFDNVEINDEVINDNDDNKSKSSSLRINSPVNRFVAQKQILENEFSLNPSLDLSITTKDSLEITMEFLKGPENINVSGAGLEKVNGDYRYFSVTKAWTLFVEGSSLCVRGNVDVDEVYKELTRLQGPEKNFRWPSNIKKCFVISELEDSVIYYAAPQPLQANRVPKNGWISLNGSTPSPKLIETNHTVSQARRRSISQNSQDTTPLPKINEDEQEELDQEILDENVQLQEDFEEENDNEEDGDISDLE